MSADMLLEDYKVKLDYLRGQYDRLWQRFNFFLSIELALFGFLGYLTFDLKAAQAATLPASIGVAVSLLWYVVGAQDRRLVEVYRTRTTTAADRVARAADGLPGFDVDHAGAEIAGGWRSVRSWYWSAISVTKLPATFGLLMTAVWIAVFVLWRPYIASIGLNLEP